jgi:hypothetical protein
MHIPVITKSRICPECHSDAVYRIRRRNLYARVASIVFNVRPHWCSACDTLFLAPRDVKHPHNPDAGISATPRLS